MKKILFPFLMLCIALSCSKTRNTPVAYLAQDFEQKFNFQKGSYWIYKDSLSGNLDSMILAGNETTLTGPSPNLDQKYENHSLYLTGQTSGSTVTSHIGIQLRAPSTFYCSYGISDASDNIIGLGGVGYPFMDFSRNDGTRKYSQQNLPSPYRVAGNNFGGVTEFFYGDVANQSTDTWCYLNDSVGVIKLHTTYKDVNGKTIIKILELQRWHILK